MRLRVGGEGQAVGEHGRRRLNYSDQGTAISASAFLIRKLFTRIDCRMQERSKSPGLNQVSTVDDVQRGARL